MKNVINAVRATVVVMIMVLCFVSSPFAAVIESAEYRPAIAVLPNTTITTWTQEGGAASTRAYIMPNALYIDAIQDDTASLFYSKTNSAQHSSDTIIVEAKVKIHQYSGNYAGGAGIWWADDSTSNLLSILSDKIRLYYKDGATPGYGPSYTMNTTDNYHTYKIVANGPNNSIKVYVDGGTTAVIDTAFDSGMGSARNLFLFGDGSSSDGALSSWEYINYRVEQ